MTKIEINKTELVWPGKYKDDGIRKEIPRVNLPFQVIETINESRASREAEKSKQLTLFDIWKGDTGETFESGWMNKLIWGDNLLVMASLLEKFAGKLNLIYIDPPFATGADFSFTAEIGEEDLQITKEQSVIEEKAYRDTWGKGFESYFQMLYERLLVMRELLADTGSIYVHADPTMNHYIKALLDEIFGNEFFHSEIVWRRSNSHNKLTGQYGPIHDTIFYYSKTNRYCFHPGIRPFSKGYIETRFKYKDDRGIYQPNYLTGPGTRLGDSGKPWKGFDPTTKGRHWAIPSSSIDMLDMDVSALSTQEILDLLLKKDLLFIPKKEGGQPMYKQYLTEGVPYQDLWSYTPNSQGYYYGTDECIDSDVKWLEQEQEKLGYATQKPEGLLKRILITSSNPGDLVADFFCGSGTTLAVAEKLGRRWIGCDLGRFAIHTTRKRLLEINGCKPFDILNLGKYERQYWQVITFGGNAGVSTEKALYEYLAFILKLYGAQPLAGVVNIHGKKGRAMVHIGSVDAPVTIDEINAAIDECVKLKQSELHVVGWEWEMGLAGPNNDYRKGGLLHEVAKQKGVKLLLLQIPRDVMEQAAVDKGDIQFFELAYLEVEIVKTNKLEVIVSPKDFVIPNTELIPEDIREKVSKWSDYIDYWAVDWDFRNDTFIQGWVAYRTRQDRSLPLKSDRHTYEKPGKYRILVKVIDIFGNDTSQAYDVQVV